MASDQTGKPLSLNVEIKARVDNLDEARRIARRVAFKSVGLQSQIDTYFCCRHGRLKLREIHQAEESKAHLIWYDRADVGQPRPSHYRLVPVTEPIALKSALQHSLGIRGHVHKRREVFLHGNVRIHLDEVDQLGTFVEFEAVLENEHRIAAGRDQLGLLLREFGILASDLVDQSYIDLRSDPPRQPSP